MNENLDLTKILDGCPEGTKFYSPLFGEVELDYIYGCLIGIVCIKMNRLYVFNAAGKYEMVEMGCSDSRGNYYYSDECLLFPSKDQRDWSKFERFWDEKSLDKPVTEKFDPKTLQPFDKVLGFYDASGEWECALFSHLVGKDSFSVVCVGIIYSKCIPYNEETKHLLGTNDDCPEYYKWWEE